MKTKSKISGHIIRSAAHAVIFLLTIVALTSGFNLTNRSLKPAGAVRSPGKGPTIPNQARALGFADRVAYQRAIEDVYWRHRIWPKENAGAKPSLDKMMSQAQIEKKVEDYLRNSQALEDYWQRPITPDQLQAEMERIASDTKQPRVLLEIFAALGNDPFVIAECLARPVLAERLVTELYAHDQRFHGELKRRAEAELRTHRSLSQMKQTSGTYTEMEWIKSDAADPVGTGVPPAQSTRLPRQKTADSKSVQAVKMNGSEWQESVEKLAAQFQSQNIFGRAPRPTQDGLAAVSLPNRRSAAQAAALQKPSVAQIKTGGLSPLQEDDAYYYALAVMNKGKDRLKLATFTWLKEPLRSWLAKAEAKVPMTMAAVTTNYTLPVISAPSAGCTDGTWTPTATTNAPVARRLHTAVWTGSEMIVWGGAINGPEIDTGGRYNPSTDSWTATSNANAPEARIYHTAIWTGSEMIVWGGLDGISLLDSGGRYNPSTDTWIATSTTNVPEAREDHSAVWTGSEMIVWGGCCTPITGGRYNPSTDSWTAISTTNVPSARFFQTAVWSGSEMIVWGGDDNTNFFNTGGRYNPGTDSWTATSTLNAPVGRQLHTAVWTGSEMIVWGGGDGMGNYLNTGGRYNPSTNSWTATSVTNAPAARTEHTAVWTGSEMIVWGGDDAMSNNTNTGGRYSPTGDSWMATNFGNAPSPRDSHSAVWSGSEMIVWGGIEMGINHLNTGGRYCAATTTPHPAFFTGEIALGGGWYYLQFANRTPFGYYFYLSDPHFIYHLDLGFEYLFDANDVNHAIYFYDFASSSFFYTSPSTFPYLYDFSLNAWLYYLPDASNPGRYSHNPRWFYNFATGRWINL